MSKEKKKDNRGLTLIELLISIGIGALVLTGVAYMIVNVLQIYARTNVNVELQNESQTAMNLVADNIMDAKGLCLVETPAIPSKDDASKTPVCVLLGDLLIHTNHSNKAVFTGDAVIWDPAAEEIYLRSYESGINLVSGGAPSAEESAKMALTEIKDSVLSLSYEDRLPFLLARYVTVFDLRVSEIAAAAKFPPAVLEINPDKPEETKEVYYYQPPMILSLHMEFAYEYKTGKFLTRTMSEDITMRNGIGKLYIERAPAVTGGMQIYHREK